MESGRVLKSLLRKEKKESKSKNEFLVFLFKSRKARRGQERGCLKILGRDD